MSSNSILNSLFSENRWTTEMSKTFPTENAVCLDLDNPPLVFSVPKELSETKPEAYAPRKVGLGPYHHLRPDLYLMQRKKLDAVMKLLNDEQRQKVQLVVNILMQRVTYVRLFYDRYLDLDPSTLAWILTVDAIYLLHFLGSYQAGRDVEDAAENGEMKKLAGDVLMLENQIPADLLIEIRRTLNLSTGDDLLGLLYQFDFFCREVSPLGLNQQEPDDIMEVTRKGHLLSFMYHLILTNRGVQARTRHGRSLDFVSRAADMLAGANVPGAAILQQQISLVERVPWESIFSQFKTRNLDEENPLMVEGIDIPSVSQLTEIAGIKFQLTPGGIRDVKFNEEEKKFHIPVITLHSNSEVVLRNLLAYEATSVEPGSTHELAEYVDLMCGIVKTRQDVEILCKEKIIVSDLEPEEIARIFNGIKRSTGDKGEKKTNVEKAIEKVKEKYDNIARIKVYKFIKKHVPSMGKFLKAFTVILLLGLFVFQAFCQIYGCDKHWFKK